MINIFKKFFIYLITLSTLILSGVNSVNAIGSDAMSTAIKGSGDIITESSVLKMSPYSLNLNHISFISSPAVKVYAHPGSQSAISITTDENILELLDIRINENENKIDITSSRMISPTAFYIEITVPLKEFVGKGKFDLDITSEKLFILNVDGDTIGKINLVKANNAAVTINGSANLNFSGISSEFDLKARGSCNIKADEFVTNNCKVCIYGNCTVSVFAYKSLDLYAEGFGKFNYAGNPQKFNKVVNGMCKIQKIN